MASSLFGQKVNNSSIERVNNMFQQVNQLKNMISGSGNPNEVVRQMVNKNPQFAQFLRENQGKSVQEICSKNGIDYSAFMNALGRKE